LGEWLGSAIEEDYCCGNNPAEDFEASGLFEGCCYNGNILNSGETDERILCYSGNLYECGTVSDDSGLATSIEHC
ncbi:MAG: hypothetical protein ACTSPF_14550, partial [Candidatus Heimdallarchaeaceae archaeon]